ncbi:MAG: FtsW/RodA/SpoVE family cell cycle protein, partial [Candidatus Babeliales bacterium]
IVVLFYFLLCFYGLRLALQLKGDFEFFTSIGFVVFISLQSVINLMVTTGLVPTKGLSLPFVSYGGTAIISLFCMMGLITNFAKNNDI